MSVAIVTRKKFSSQISKFKRKSLAMSAISMLCIFNGRPTTIYNYLLDGHTRCHRRLSRADGGLLSCTVRWGYADVIYLYKGFPRVTITPGTPSHPCRPVTCTYIKGSIPRDRVCHVRESYTRFSKHSVQLYSIGVGFGIVGCMFPHCEPRVRYLYIVWDTIYIYATNKHH